MLWSCVRKRCDLVGRYLKHTACIIGVATGVVLSHRHACSHSDVSAAAPFDAPPYSLAIFPRYIDFLRMGCKFLPACKLLQPARQPSLQSLPARFRTPMESGVPKELYKQTKGRKFLGEISVHFTAYTASEFGRPQ